MSYVIICRGDALGNMTDDSKYLVYFDPDANDGMGEVIWGDLMHARRFDSAIEAMRVWRMPSIVRPYRDDGHPNRPLTAWNIEPWKEDP
jgi:hypothetical protein